MTHMFQPLSDYVVVKETKEETTKGGLILVDERKDQLFSKGEVVKCGPGRDTDAGMRIATHVKVGDKVLFNKFGPAEVEIEGIKYLVMRDHDVVALLGLTDDTAEPVEGGVVEEGFKDTTDVE